MCPLVLENSPTFGLKSHAGTSAARALSVCRSCCPSVCPSRIMIIRSPINTRMLLKTKRVLEFEILPDHAEQKPEDCTFVGLPLSLFMGCHGRIIQYTNTTTFVSLAYERVSYEFILPFRVILVIRIHVKLVAPVRTESTTAYYEYIGCGFCGCKLIVQYCWYSSVAKSMDQVTAVCSSLLPHFCPLATKRGRVQEVMSCLNRQAIR